MIIVSLRQVLLNTLLKIKNSEEKIYLNSKVTMKIRSFYLFYKKKHAALNTESETRVFP